MHVIWITLLFAGIGGLDYTYRAKPFVYKDLNGEYIIKGTVIDVKTLTNGDRFNLAVNNILDEHNKSIECRNLKFLLKTDGLIANKGDIIEFKSKPKSINTYSKSTQFNERMKKQGILYFDNLRYENIHKIDKKTGLLTLSNRFKTNLEIDIEKSKFKRETGDFLISIILGDKSFLSSDTRQALNSAGMAHILSLSGMHVAIILSIIMILLFPLNLVGKRKFRMGLAIILVWFYVCLTGGSPSTVRAAIMASFIAGSFILERKNSSINALFAAAFFILLIDPLTLWNIGFQLSFLCVLSILTFTTRLNPIDRHIHPGLFKITNMVLITIISVFVTWSLIIYYFGQIPLLFLPSNILLLPFLPIFIGLGILYIGLISLGIDWPILVHLLDYYYEFFINGASLLSLNETSVLNIKVPYESTILWLIGIFFILMSFYFRQRNLKILSSFLSIGILFSSITLIFYKDNTESFSLKFPSNLTNMEANFLNGGKSSRLIFPMRSISESHGERIHILSIDNKIQPDAIEIIKKRFTGENNFILVGPKADFSQIAELTLEGNFNSIILHSGINKKKKENLLQLMDIGHWDKVYSLRESGSLEFDL
ncbi:MAG: ComEC/Rec2 family competence protein [Muribaculaceae bacterium]|nr:ComEC/Rec2 family competence protein [Muribaculaceae bacterium]